MLALHNICLPKHSIDQCQDALIYHLLSGACINHNMDVTQCGSVRCPDRGTCHNLSVEFKSAAEMAYAALNFVISSNISTDKLLKIVRTLGFNFSEIKTATRPQ